MSRIPNVRENEYYNQKYLLQQNAELLKGYDMALSEIRSLFNNLDVYYPDFELEDEDINFARFLDKHEKVREQFLRMICDWHESSRNILVTSMIDGMGEEEYEKSRKEIDSGSREAYYKEV